MSDDVLTGVLGKLEEEDLLEERLTISWHGAEPLFPGLAWYQHAFATIDRLLPGISVRHVFQSNGVLIDDAWCEFFKLHNAIVGVSLDGDADQSSSRVNWAGLPAYPRAIKGIQALRRNGIDWTLLTVVTYATMLNPGQFTDFVRRTGCSGLGFKIEETNVAHTSALPGTAEIEALFAAFVQHLWVEFATDERLRVREFDEYLAARRQPRRQVRPVTVVPMRNLTVAANGDFTVFSGELLFRQDDLFVFGNVLEGPLLGSLQTEKFAAVASDILSGIRLCASNCEFYKECGSFYISQKHAETGSFVADETLACRLEIKTLYRALDDVSGIVGPAA